MEPQFVDRLLICSDCHGEFIFTAGEQLFFYEKQFKNDPKRCKPCKSRRSGLAAVANGNGPAAAGLSRTETRTECSECGVQTTVPFKPTQGRPVLCRQCFQAKARAAATKPADGGAAGPTHADTIAALQDASSDGFGATLSPDAAVVAAATMASASSHSSVASAADLASITPSPSSPQDDPSAQKEASAMAGKTMLAQLVAAAANGDVIQSAQEHHASASDGIEA